MITRECSCADCTTYNPASITPQPISTTEAVTHALFMEGMTFCGYQVNSYQAWPMIIQDDIAQITCRICQHSPTKGME